MRFTDTVTKAVEKVQACLIPNKKGYYSIPADGGKYWTIGTSEGKFGEFAKYQDTFFPVNAGGYVYAKEGTEKGDKLVEFLNSMVAKMNELNDARINDTDDDE